MPSENVVKDKRKKARAAKTARIEGTGFQQGMAPDFNYTPVGEYADQEPGIRHENYESRLGSEYDNNRRMERRLFELLRQQPGEPERFLPTGFDFIRNLGTVNRMDRTTEKLKLNHPDVFNPYKTRKQYQQKKRISGRKKSIEQFLGELLTGSGR